MQDMTCAVQVCLSLTVPFTEEELFVSWQWCFPWGVFFPSPFAIFTACFPCFPSCICKAASNKALADNLILKHNESCSFHSAGARPGWGARPHTQPCLGHHQQRPLAGAGQSQTQQGGQERGSCRGSAASGHLGRFALKWNAINSMGRRND